MGDLVKLPNASAGALYVLQLPPGDLWAVEHESRSGGSSAILASDLPSEEDARQEARRLSRALGIPFDETGDDETGGTAA